jgi:hypothetical protein
MVAVRYFLIGMSNQGKTGSTTYPSPSDSPHQPQSGIAKPVYRAWVREVSHDLVRDTQRNMTAIYASPVHGQTRFGSRSQGGRMGCIKPPWVVEPRSPDALNVRECEATARPKRHNIDPSSLVLGGSMFSQV